MIEIEKREMVGKNSIQNRTALQCTEFFLAQTESTLTALKAMPRRLGTTILASCKGINQEGQLLNCAFVTCFADPIGSDAPVYFNSDQGHFFKPENTTGANLPNDYDLH